jgi:hypothetical protein
MRCLEDAWERLLPAEKVGGQSLARSVVRGTAVAEETAKFGVSHIMSPLADFGTGEKRRHRPPSGT